MGLSTKQLAFIENYLTHWNGTKAAIDAGYSARSARSIASENLTKPDIQAAIAARLVELKMSADEVLTRLTEHARGSIGPFIRVTPGGELRGFDLGDDKPVQLVRRATHTRRTYKDGSSDDSVTIEIHDSQAALALLGKHHKLFTDQVEHSGSVDIKGYTRVSPDDWDKPPEGDA